MATKKNTSKEVTKTSPLKSIKSFFETVSENVIEGASIVTEKIKDNSAKAYVAGSELVEETNEKIHKYTDKISLEKEQKRLENRQEKISNEFGKITLAHYLKNDSLHKAFLNQKGIESLVTAYKANEKELVAIDKKLKKINT